MTQYQLFVKSGVPKSTIHNIIHCAYDSVKLRIIHELCHAALSCANIDSNNHSGNEWDYLCNYFEKLGYDPFRDGYSYGVKAN